MVYAMCEGASGDNLQKIADIVKDLVQRLQDIDSGTAAKKCKARKEAATGPGKQKKQSGLDTCFEILDKGQTKFGAKNCQKAADCFGTVDAATGVENPGQCLGKAKAKRCFYDHDKLGDFMLPCIDAKLSDVEMRWLKTTFNVSSDISRKDFLTAFKASVLSDTCVGPNSIKYPSDSCYDDMFVKSSDVGLKLVIGEITEDDAFAQWDEIFAMCDPKPFTTKETCEAQRICNWGADLEQDCTGLPDDQRYYYECKPVTVKECAQGPRIENKRVYKQDKFFCDFQGTDLGTWDRTRRSKQGCERGICTIAPWVSNATQCEAVKSCSVDCLVDGVLKYECSSEPEFDAVCEDNMITEEYGVWGKGGWCALSETKQNETIDAWKACDVESCQCVDRDIPANEFMSENGTALDTCAALKGAGFCSDQSGAVAYYCAASCEACVEDAQVEQGSARRARRLRQRGLRSLYVNKKLRRRRRLQNSSGTTESGTADDDVDCSGDNAWLCGDAGDDEEFDFPQGACPASSFKGCPAAEAILEAHLAPESDCGKALEALDAGYAACEIPPKMLGDALCTSHGYCHSPDFFGEEVPAERRLRERKQAAGTKYVQQRQESGLKRASVRRLQEAGEGEGDAEDFEDDMVKPSTDQAGCEGPKQCEDKPKFTEETCTQCDMDYSQLNTWEAGELIVGQFLAGGAAGGGPTWTERSFDVANQWKEGLDFDKLFSVFDAAITAMQGEDAASEIECMIRPIITELKKIVCLCDSAITEGDACSAALGSPAKVAEKTVFKGVPATVKAGDDSGIELGAIALASDTKVEVTTVSAASQKSGAVSTAANAAFETTVGNSKDKIQASSSTTAAPPATTTTATNTTATTTTATTTTAEATPAEGGTRRLAETAVSACGFDVVYAADGSAVVAQLGSNGYGYSFGTLSTASKLCIKRDTSIPVDTCKFDLALPILAKKGSDKIVKVSSATLKAGSFCADVTESGTYYLGFEGPGPDASDASCISCEASKIAEAGQQAAATRSIKVETAAQAEAREVKAAEATTAQAKQKAQDAVSNAKDPTTSPVTTTATTTAAGATTATTTKATTAGTTTTEAGSGATTGADGSQTTDDSTSKATETTTTVADANVTTTTNSSEGGSTLSGAPLVGSATAGAAVLLAVLVW